MQNKSFFHQNISIENDWLYDRKWSIPKQFEPFEFIKHLHIYLLMMIDFDSRFIRLKIEDRRYSEEKKAIRLEWILKLNSYCKLQSENKMRTFRQIKYRMNDSAVIRMMTDCGCHSVDSILLASRTTFDLLNTQSNYPIIFS